MPVLGYIRKSGAFYIPFQKKWGQSYILGSAEKGAIRHAHSYYAIYRKLTPPRGCIYESATVTLHFKEFRQATTWNYHKEQSKIICITTPSVRLQILCWFDINIIFLVFLVVTHPLSVKFPTNKIAIAAINWLWDINKREITPKDLLMRYSCRLTQPSFFPIQRRLSLKNSAHNLLNEIYVLPILFPSSLWLLP